MDNILRFGVIGCGTVAGYGHIPTLASLEDYGIKLEALCDINPEAMKPHSEKFGIRRLYTDWKEMLLDGGLEAAAVSTHIDTHHPITMACLGAGIHVMCEKPLSVSAGLAGEMASLAEEKKLCLGVDFILRTADYVNIMRDAIRAGKIGQVRVVRILDAWSGPDWHGAKPGRKAGYMKEGGPLFGEAIHHWDLAHFLTGKRIKSIESFGVRVEDYQWPDHALAVAFLEDGTMFVHESSWAWAFNVETKAANERSKVVMGTQGALRWAEMTRKVEIISSQGCEEIECGREKDFSMLYRGFADWVRTGIKPDFVAGGEDGLEAQKASEMAMKSLGENINKWGQAPFSD